MENTCRLYTDLAWLWPMWGNPDEYAHYCRHVAGLIEQHAERPAGTLLDIGCGGGKNVFSLDTWRRVLRDTGFKVHEGRYNAGADDYTVFACVKTR